jgi:hypothetical protein
LYSLINLLFCFVVFRCCNLSFSRFRSLKSITRTACIGMTWSLLCSNRAPFWIIWPTPLNLTYDEVIYFI